MLVCLSFLHKSKCKYKGYKKLSIKNPKQGEYQLQLFMYTDIYIYMCVYVYERTEFIDLYIVADYIIKLDTLLSFIISVSTGQTKPYGPISVLFFFPSISLKIVFLDFFGFLHYKEKTQIQTNKKKISKKSPKFFFCDISNVKKKKKKKRKSEESNTKHEKICQKKKKTISTERRNNE
ncbi:uncharacterized protein PWA37_005107 [Arxiozyma heterogenica]|uniref:uncharacterized protein n=1 Tax=Arxiozyma heterogenica TaxID=278026 RepID=UPI002F1873D7